MSFIKGKDGLIQIGGVSVGQVTDWQYSISKEAIENTRVGNEWKRYLLGKRSQEFVINGFIDMGNTEQLALVNALLSSTASGVLSSIRFVLSGPDSYDGTGVVTKFGIQNSGNDSVVRFSALVVCGSIFPATGYIACTQALIQMEYFGGLSITCFQALVQVEHEG